MTPIPLHKGLYGRPASYPEACEPLEEVGAAPVSYTHLRAHETDS